MDKKRIIVVLGMHRSGTSALTRGLDALGVTLGEDLNPANFANPKGYWEDEGVMQINETVLERLDASYHSLGLVDPQETIGEEFDDVRHQAIALLRRKLASTSIWGFKDPRTCRLLSFWKTVFAALSCEVAYVISVRNPISVADSLRKRDGFAPVKSYYLWLEHLLGALSGSAGAPRLVVEYDKLLEAAPSQLNRIAKQLALASPSADQLREYAKEFLEGGLRHSHYSLKDVASNPDVPRPVFLLYQLLAEAAADEVDLDSHAFAVSWTPIQNEWQALKPILRELDTQERALTARERSLQASNATIGNLQEQLNSCNATAKNFEQRLIVSDTNIYRMAERMVILEEEREKSAEDLRRLQQHVDDIHQSRSWRLANRLSRLHARVRRSHTKEQGAVQSAHPRNAEEFDRDYYLRANPDVAASGADPYQHYMTYGKGEGRRATPVDADALLAHVQLPDDRQNVLVVTHEASRSGAPILSFNIAEALANRYNVVVLTFGPGPLIEDFKAQGIPVLGPFPFIAGNPYQAELLLDAIVPRLKFQFAITNSIVCAPILPGLAKHYVPNVTLIHEFAAYTRPRDIFAHTALWSGQIVFSTKVTLESAIKACSALDRPDVEVIPQGQCAVPRSAAPTIDSRVGEERRILQALRGGDEGRQSFVVIGLGTVQMRKGVDLFIACAKQLVRSNPRIPYRFVWIGTGYAPETDLEYSVYIADQIARSELEGRLDVIGETPYIDVAYDNADVLLLSSRLDPLPNVAIDSMSRGLPVVCFDRTTGIAEILKEEGLEDSSVAPYLDIEQLAQRVEKLACSAEYRTNLGEQQRRIAQRRFDMASYVRDLERLATARTAVIARERETASLIEKSGLVRMDFMLPPDMKRLTPEAATMFYVRAWNSGVRRRKPFPGFNPWVYSTLKALPADADPLAHYIQNQQPKGPWLTEVLDGTVTKRKSLEEVRIGLHIHVHYPDLLPDILSRLRQSDIRPDLLLSVTSPSALQTVQSMVAGYTGKIAHVAVTPNRGRDIGPFLSYFASMIQAHYDIIGHLHTKKSVDIGNPAVGTQWFQFLLDNLVGGVGGSMGRTILERMALDPTVGMVFPDDPNICDWGQNLPFAEQLADRLGLEQLPAAFEFPVGTMFWARTEALKPLFDLGLNWDDYPAEPLPYDGSMLHAIERLLPLVVQRQGKRVVLSHYANSTR